MKPRPGWGLALALVLLAAGPSLAQQPSVQITGAAQVMTGDDLRLAGQRRVDPDLSVIWFDRGTRLGAVRFEFGVTRRDERAVLSRTAISLDEVTFAGLSWSIAGGDVAARPAVRDFGLANLFAPDVSFEGAAVHGSNGKVSIHAAGGRFTVLRNIFGTDVDTIEETVFQGEVTVRPTPEVEAFVRGSRVRNGDIGAYSSLVDASQDVGAGLRYRPSGSWQVSLDASASAFRRRGSPRWERAPSGLAGALWNGAHGSFQIDLYRFSAGRFAAANFPYSDRSGAFVNGDYDLGRFAKAYGGVDAARTNLDPQAAAVSRVALPEGTQVRGFGGVRLRLTDRATINVRAETGARVLRPSSVQPGQDSDTGLWALEFHQSRSRGNMFARYERRSNVDVSDPGGLRLQSGFTQHEVYSQFFNQLGRGAQVFASAHISRREDRDGGGQSNWQGGGGVQVLIKNRNLRVEALLGRTRDWTTGVESPRETLSAGFSGKIAPRTFLSFDLFLDHSFPGLPDVSPWMTRSMIRVTHAFSYGVAHGLAGSAVASRRVASGSVDGMVFVDWNGNGAMDPGDEPAKGIAINIGRLASLTSGNDGRFAFGRLPVGEREVSLDGSTVPADYDLPAESSRTVTVDRKHPVTVLFGLLPVGTIQGVVFLDTDGDRQRGDADEPIGDAVAVLDDGSRSAQARAGRFHFGGVRLGDHTVTLLMQSLPDGAQLTGPGTVDVALTRDATTARVTFLVKLEKRPEIRKVFPPKKK